MKTLKLSGNMEKALIPVKFSFFVNGEWKQVDATYRSKDAYIIIGSHTCCPIEDFGDYKMTKIN